MRPPPAKHSSSLPSSGALSYEQAQKLGLVGDEK